MAQPSLVAARYVMRLKAHVQRLRSMELSFTLGTSLSTTNELRNVTHATRVRWVARNSGPIFRRLWTKVH